MFLDPPPDVIRNVAQFRLRVHTLRYETATGNHRSPLTCDLCEADDNVQDEQHVLFHCTHPQAVSLRRKYAPLFSQASHDVSAFYKKLPFSFMNYSLFMSRPALLIATGSRNS